MAEHGLTSLRPRAVSETTRAWKLSSLAILFVLLSAAAIGTAGTLKEPDWSILWQSLLFGLLLGWALAILHQPGWRAAGIIVMIGVAYVLIFPGGLAAQALALGVELGNLALRLLIYPAGQNIDLGPMLHIAQNLNAAAEIILGRVAAWISGLVTGEPLFDPVAATLAWNALMWYLAAWAGWTVEARRSPLLAALPAILLCLSTLGYARQMSPVLYLMLGAILLMLALVQQQQRQKLWDEMEAAYPAQKGRQILGAALLATTGLVMISGLLSSSAIQRIQDWVTKLRRPAVQHQSDLAQSLGILPNSTLAPDAFEEVRSPSLPRQLLIGSGPELSQRRVMAVSVGAVPTSSEAGVTLPLYWRSFTYDVYTGQGWSSSQTEEILYQPGDLLRSEHTRDELVLEQRFVPMEDLGGAVYAAGEPVSMDQSAQAAWRSPGDLFGVHMDSSTGYEIVSSVPVASELHLRAAGQQYPDWVRRRFLSLPTNIPGRVKALGAQLTASQSTPYDRARAIEQYLRAYPYTLNVTRPPVNRDVVDFFLFDLKKGYCDYYASAMVVLARAAGVPARLAVGYASGTYNLNSKRYLVTEADAHTWVEVYFPGIGWVPFEPTAARPELERTPVVLQQTPENPVLPAQTPSADATGFDFLQAMWFAFVAVAAALLAWGVFDEWRLRRLPQPASASEVYGRMRQMGQLLHAASTPGDTPFEFSAALMARVRLLTARPRSRALGLRTVEDVDKIATGIVRANYGPSQSMELGIPSQWRRLRWRLRMIWLLQTWQSIRGRLSRSVSS